LALALGACSFRVPFGDDRDGGSQPTTTLATLPRNTALDLGRMNCTDLVDGGGYACQQIIDWSTFVYDRPRHQMLMFGGGSHATARTDVAAFDFATLTWQSAYPPTACADMTRDNVDWTAGAWLRSGHPIARQTYDMLVMTLSPAELVMLTYSAPGEECLAWSGAAVELEGVPGRVAHYDPDARHWRFTDASTRAWGPYAAAETDPVSGLVVVISDAGLWTYDPATATIGAHQAFSNPRLGYASQLVYFPPNQRMYYITRDHLVFEVTLDRVTWEKTTVAELTTQGPVPPSGAQGWAFDAGRGILGGGVQGGVFHTFDPAARRWASQTMQILPAGASPPPNNGLYTLAYDPVDGVFIFVTDYAGGWHTWAYRN
jgi:hypothetical protein